MEQKVNDQNFEPNATQILESMVRNNEVFKKIFVNGIDQHINNMRVSSYSGTENSDVSQSINNYSDLKDVVGSGFEGYDLRICKLDSKGSLITMYFAKPGDLDPADSTKLDLSNGAKRREIEIVFQTLRSPDGYRTDPAKVYANRGIHMEIKTKSVFFHPRAEKVYMQAENGYSVNMTRMECTGKATRYDGHLPYDSRKIYPISADPTLLLKIFSVIKI